MQHIKFPPTSALIVLGILSAPAAAQVAPTLSVVTPRAAPAQAVAVTLRGEGLLQPGHATEVTFNGTPVAAQDMLFQAPDTLIVLVPETASTGPVVVEVGGEASNSLEFSVVATGFKDDQVVTRFIRGASIGRGLVETETDLLAIVPVGTHVYHLLGIPDGRGVAQVIRELFGTGLVADASANLRTEPFALPSKQNAPAPEDPLFGPEQYGPQRIHAADQNDATPDAHRLELGDGLTIAIIDSGVETTHEDLAAKVGRSLDATTLPAGPAPVADDHGTHVAGIAAADTGNGLGIAGIAPDARLFNIKTLGGAGFIANTGLASALAIRYAVGRGARVLNMSYGSNAQSGVETAAIAHALRNGVVPVAAAGNDGDGNPGTADLAAFPAALSETVPRVANGVIAVANSDMADMINGSSTNGAQVDVAAPGTDIHSSILGSTYGELSGTSMAAPHVSGVAALLLDADGNLTPARVECLLELTSVDILERGFDIASGHGRVNAYAAVHAVRSLRERYELMPPECNVPPPRLGNPGRGGGDGGDRGGGFPGIPGIFGDLRILDQVVPITTDSATAYVALDEGGTLRVDLPAGTVAALPGAPFSDPVITSDDAFALVQGLGPHPDVDPDTIVRQFNLADNSDVATLAIPTSVSELTLTHDGQFALVGTVESVEVIEVGSLRRATAPMLQPVTGISVTPDGQFAFVGDPAGVKRIGITAAPPSVDAITTGLPITGVTVAPDGSAALVGTQQGITIIDPAAAAVVAHVAAPTPVSNIAISPDSAWAAYAMQEGLVLVELASQDFVTLPTAETVTDVDITASSDRALVGTVQGVSIAALSLTPPAAAAVATAPLTTGLNLSPDDAWAAVGTDMGVSLVDLTATPPAHVPVALPGAAVRNVAISADGDTAVSGFETGVAVIDLATQAVQTSVTPRPLIAATVSPDGAVAVLGTAADIRVVDLSTGVATDVHPVPPILNDLPDAAQGPNNPSGERGTDSRREG